MTSWIWGSMWLLVSQGAVSLDVSWILNRTGCLDLGTLDCQNKRFCRLGRVVRQGGVGGGGRALLLDHENMFLLDLDVFWIVKVMTTQGVIALVAC